MIRDIYERLGLTSNLATERSKVNQRLYLILPKVWYKISETNRTDVFYDMELRLGKKLKNTSKIGRISALQIYLSYMKCGNFEVIKHVCFE